jgi:hypothetical protein
VAKTKTIQLMPSSNRQLITMTAYHEAGHAVIGWRDHNYVREGGIRIQESGDGGTDIMPLSLTPKVWRDVPRDSDLWPYWQMRAEADCCMWLAGPLSELRFQKLRGGLLRPLTDNEY